MECRLTRIRSTHQNLRTCEIVGECPFEPAKGISFSMTATPLDPAMTVRLISTTKILKTTPSEEGKVMEFETENSAYKWELLDSRTPIAQPDRATAS